MKRRVMTGGRMIEYMLVQTAHKRVSVQALPEGETRVYAPRHIPLRDIDALVCAVADQIDELHRQLDRRLAEEHNRHPMTEGATVFVEGKPHVMHLHEGRAHCEISEGELHLWLKTPKEEEAVRGALKAALSARALERIRQRLDVYAPKVGGTYGRVTIRDQRSRWGSCSAKHNLNFNWKLIMAPPQALDYVVIHELCHLRELNHSPRFWALVEKQMPEYQAWKKWLDVHGDELGVG